LSAFIADFRAADASPLHFRSCYVCDDKFHTEGLSELLTSDDTFGFIIMDGNGTLFGKLAGNTREVIYRFAVDLPKKHSRGGQSSQRFSRQRDEQRHNYVRKVAEMAVQHFITNDKVNVTGLVLAGSADFKTELGQSDLFDQRLSKRVIKTVDVGYGGQNGFNQVCRHHPNIYSNHRLFVSPIGNRSCRRVFDKCQICPGKNAYSKIF
jgi:peptide chain release factor subunit 1